MMPTSTHEPPDTLFAGFDQAAFVFLAACPADADRAWFADNQAAGDRLVQAPLRALAAAVTYRLAATSVPLQGDISGVGWRLAHDACCGAQRPLGRPHAHAAWTPMSGHVAAGRLCLHLSADTVRATVGFHHPAPHLLRRFRAGLRWDPDGWLAVRRGLLRRGLDLAADDSPESLQEGLATAPPDIRGDVRRTSWTVERAFPTDLAQGDALVEAVAGLVIACADLLDFGWSAISDD